MKFDEDVVSPHRALFLAVRNRILANDGVTEIKKEKITTYYFNNAGLCHLRTMPHGVDVGFLKGAYLNDRYRMLQGQTKRMRILSLKRDMKDELSYYLNEAISLNK